MFGQDWTHWLWILGRLKVRVFCAGFRVWSYMVLSLPCVTYLRLLPDGWEGGVCRAAPPRKSGYSGVFYSRRTWVPVECTMWLAGFSRSTVPHLPLPFEQRSEDRSSVPVLGEPRCKQKACNRLRKEGAEQNICETSGTNKKNWYDRDERNNEGSAVGSTNSAKTLDRKVRVAEKSSDKVTAN